MKPKAFIASSVEGLRYAYAIQENLEYDAEYTVWSQGVFTPSAYPIDDLLDELNQSDFGIFVFSPDDVVTMRKEESKAIRDNVVLEIGLFIGRLGRKRNFMLQPNDVNDLHIPTDLTGLTPIKFDRNRSDANIVAGMGVACNKIREALLKLGSLSETVEKVVSELDPKCVQFMASYGQHEFFSAPRTEEVTSALIHSFDQAVQRLISLKILRFELSGDGAKYAYHWTELGKMVLEKYSFDTPPAEDVTTEASEIADKNDLGLSKEAEHILAEAVRDKNGTLMMVGTMHGLVVQTNGRNFTEGADRKTEAFWKAAVEELYKHAFLEDRAGKHEVFQVTANGFKAGELLSLPKDNQTSQSEEEQAD
ncbi:TIR domain-containing protein [Gimesia panareensis]|nr:nucleotide-binding protein [Gimesia panareensis]